MNNYYNNYLLYQVANTPVRTYPWKHVLYSELLHPDLYQQVLDNLPDKNALSNIHDTLFHFKNSSPNRLTLSNFNLLPANMQHFWYSIKEMFTDGKLMKIILEKFNTEINNSYYNESKIEYTKYFDTFQLTLDKQGYFLTPHPDIIGKIFTIVVNLPSHEHDLDMGTVVYGSNNDEDVIFKSRYIPNTGFGVFRSDNSWHGVEETKSDRWTIQYTVWGEIKTPYGHLNTMDILQRLKDNNN